MAGTYNTSKNLGQVRFVHVGMNPPSNTNMMWLNQNFEPNVWYWFDNVANQWVQLNQNSNAGSLGIGRLDSKFGAAMNHFSSAALLNKELVMVFIEKQFVHQGTDIEDMNSYDQPNGNILLNQQYFMGARITVYFKL